MKIILASESPRRRELLEMMGLKFDIKPSNSDETFKEGLSIEEQSKRLAHIKAKSVFDETSNEGDRAVIGSDTMVIEGDKIYGKPHTREQAIEMLQDLNNTKHTKPLGAYIICLFITGTFLSKRLIVPFILPDLSFTIMNSFFHSVFTAAHSGVCIKFVFGFVCKNSFNSVSMFSPLLNIF